MVVAVAVASNPAQMTGAQLSDEMAKVVKDIGLKEATWGDNKWKKIGDSVTQENLDDVFKRGSEVARRLLPGIAIREAPKSAVRLQEKLKEEEGKLEKNQKPNWFRPVTDILAGRVNCDVREIKSLILRLKKAVNQMGGVFEAKRASKVCPYGVFFDRKNMKYTDIAQFAYVWSEKLGSPMEIQIGHEFARHTFKIDSALRESRKAGKGEDGLVDLWHDDFYGHVKSYILARANGQAPSMTKQQILDEAVALHKKYGPEGNKEVPADLKAILERLDQRPGTRPSSIG